MSFSLRAAGEAIGLFAADGTPIDAVTFTNQIDNVSMGRGPDGSGNIIELPMASPRGGNGGIQPPAAPRLAGVILIGGTQIEFMISTEVGRSYQVLYKDELSAPAWSLLGSPRIAASTNLVVIDAPASGSQRFYRAVVVP